MPSVFLVAGESSGDTHGAHLVRALRAAEPAIRCEGLGGEQMAAAGMSLRHDLAGRAIMGFTEVLKSLGYIRRIFNETVEHLSKERPDCLVLIDYPGFNIRLAEKAKTLGIPVVYYISPQVWAWKKGRIHTLARTVDRMLLILPFEVPLYREVGLRCSYVGHPLMDHIPEVPIEGLFRGPMTIGLLPGSREQEIGRILPVMLEVAQGIRARHPEARFVTPCVNAERQAQIEALAEGFPLETTVGKAYEVLDAARFCMVASGTATVETCIFGAPMVIIYRISPISYRLARMLVRIDHVGMVNILAKRRIVPEFIQQDATPEKILPVALDLIEETPARSEMLKELEAVCQKLGSGGASARAAGEILEVIHGDM